jgi:hypothetical protein
MTSWPRWAPGRKRGDWNNIIAIVMQSLFNRCCLET